MAEGGQGTSQVSAVSVNLNGDRENSAKPVTVSLPMNGGNGTYSYSRNSNHQKLSAGLEKGKTIEEIEQKLDMKKLSSLSNTIHVADLGCSTGPNTFMIIHDILEAMQRKYKSQLSQPCPHDDQIPEFQVFFNDLESNDFNTLFTTLPQDMQYFAAGVPGSFHLRLFPDSSIHLVHSSLCLHRISKSPEVLQNKASPAWNKGRIHYTSAPDEVVEVYASQFAEDMENFLNARAKELVPKGMMVMILTATLKGMPYSELPTGMWYDSLSSVLMDMAKERRCTEDEKRKFIEEIEQKLDMKKLFSLSNTIRLADLGCATGPNTFMIIQDILEAMQRKHQSQLSQSCFNDVQHSDDHQMPEFQVFFNDQESNDFNTLFTSLPQDRQYFAAGVPGSFHHRLFPESSIHFVHTSLCLHWISKSPEVLQNKASPTWNKGRIHYTSAPDEVVEAYASQFAEDMENFLNARAKELVPEGMMVMILVGIPKGTPYSEIPMGMMCNCLSSSLMDMAKEGIIEESEVDSFNLPFYAASLEEMEEILEKNGCFKIERMESTNPAAYLKGGPVDIPAWVTNVRAAMEGMFAIHFGSEVMEEMFGRLTDKLVDIADLINSRCEVKSQLLAVLKRK